MDKPTQDREAIARVSKALREIRRGKMVILTDDEDRENEGDLVMAAEKITPQAINFMAKHGRGLICLSLTEERLKQLQLPLMVQDNSSSFGTAFTVSVEAARGVTTGISAADRAHTIRVCVAKDAKPADLVRPGHIFPLRAREGGVLVRTGQTEGSVDLSRMAGLYPAGVICEVMNEDGTMARRSELLRFSKKHQLTLLSVADIITYRLAHERLVRRVATEQVVRAPFGDFTAHAYKSDVDPEVHVALVKGDVSNGTPVLVRMHRASVLGDLLDPSSTQTALEAISKEGRGVLVYLHKHATPTEALAQRPATGTLRELGVGAQILKDLGLSKLRLITSTPKRIVGLDSYGLTVVEQVKPGEKTVRSKPMARYYEGNLVAPPGRFAICVSRFNSFITDALLSGALDALKRHGVDDDAIDVYRVPGTFELTGLVRKVVDQGRHAGVVCLGCVIRGGTPHFEYVAGEVSKGIGQIAANAPCAVTFGVLTCDTVEQAVDRAGVKAGNKGAEAAVACIEMVNLHAQLAADRRKLEPVKKKA